MIEMINESNSVHNPRKMTKSFHQGRVKRQDHLWVEKAYITVTCHFKTIPGGFSPIVTLVLTAHFISGLPENRVLSSSV